MLEDSKQNIQGFCLLDNSTINNQIFVNDTTLYLFGTLKNLTWIMLTLNRFCEVLGEKVN